MTASKDGKVPVIMSLDSQTGQPIHDPRDYLRRLMAIIRAASQGEWDIPPEKVEKILRLRRGGAVAKRVRELKDACIFAILFEQVLVSQYGGEPVHMRVIPAKDEADDVDAYAVWEARGVSYVSPLQLKELPPGDLNPLASVDELLRGLTKYPRTSTPPVVAIHLNRRERIEEVTIPSGLNIASIWCFGSAEPDASRWWLVGDLLSETVHHLNLPLQ